jgi:hypothetical protein
MLDPSAIVFGRLSTLAAGNYRTRFSPDDFYLSPLAQCFRKVRVARCLHCNFLLKVLVPSPYPVTAKQVQARFVMFKMFLLSVVNPKSNERANEQAP